MARPLPPLPGPRSQGPLGPATSLEPGSLESLQPELFHPRKARCGGTQRQAVTIERPLTGHTVTPRPAPPWTLSPPPQAVCCPLSRLASRGRCCSPCVSELGKSLSSPTPSSLGRAQRLPQGAAPGRHVGALTPGQTGPPDALAGLAAADAPPPSPPTSTHSVRPESSTFSAGNPWQPRGWAPTPLLSSLVPELSVCSPATEAASWGRVSGEALFH